MAPLGQHEEEPSMGYDVNRQRALIYNRLIWYKPKSATKWDENQINVDTITFTVSRIGS